MTIYLHSYLGPSSTAGALGPSPATILPQADAEDLVKRCATEWGRSARKVAARRRWQLYTEDFTDLLEERVLATVKTPEIREQLREYIGPTHNLALDVTRQVCQVYKQGVRRSIDGATVEQMSALGKALAESRLDIWAPQWNRLAFLIGPVMVCPMVRNGRLTYETLMPHYYDILRDPNDPMGVPLAIAWTIRGEEDIQSVPHVILLDGQAWTYYRTHPTLEIVDRVEHNLGYLPAEPLRFDTPFDADWWNCSRNERLLSATLEIGVVGATLNLIRKSQNKKLLTIVGDLTAVPKGQTLHNELPLTADTGGGLQGTGGNSQVDISAIDFETSPDSFIKHIQFIAASVIESFGIPASAITFDYGSGTEGERVATSHEGLTEIRNEQIPFVRTFEHGLIVKTIGVMRALNHPLAELMPSDEQVRDGYRVEFPRLARTFADPLQEKDFVDWELSRGLTNHRELLRVKYPNLDDEQLDELLLSNIEIQAKFIAELTKRDMSVTPGSPDAAQTPAQLFGAQGPKVRDGKQQPESDDDGEE
jgi:hypothetical protein